ncbi:DUF3311 domain-containing protein [Streptomyces formicae]|uniref:DUF3311 domain-containing protein n=1 Tax=Streptomyces formicae TaxID=1616117 RepID=A0A291Q9C4_9ACTN|nr:DUF3311 domain-containing protein [Streptomyces formicae]ATL28034.1 hypothetical protein KY5_3016c [Streptomyces formicae]
MIARRPHLLWLLVPFVLYIGALPFVNRLRPVVFGLPFLFFWLLGATVLTPFSVWLARRGDRKQSMRKGHEEGAGGRA